MTRSKKNNLMATVALWLIIAVLLAFTSWILMTSYDCNIQKYNGVQTAHCAVLFGYSPN